MTIRAIFFDFAGTLVRFLPEQETLLVSAAATRGITLSLQAARQGFASVTDWWSRQLAQVPLEERPGEEREALYREFDQRVLAGAGVNTTQDLAYEIFGVVMRQASGSRLVAFEDVLPTLSALQQKGMNLGVVSNMGRTLPQLLATVGLKSYFPIIVSSGEVGITKPHPGIFQAALHRAALDASEALYVGDQYEYDVVGARSAGLIPILVDRYGLLSHHADCLRVGSLEELPAYVEQVVP